MVIDLYGNIFISGQTFGFFPGFVNLGNADAFIARLGLPNQPPFANAGPDLIGNEGQNFTFDSSGSSDPDGIGDIVSLILTRPQLRLTIFLQRPTFLSTLQVW